MPSADLCTYIRRLSRHAALAATMRRVAGLLSISRHCTVPPIPVTSRQMLPSSAFRGLGESVEEHWHEVMKRLAQDVTG
jgi:hypothetical protein